MTATLVCESCGQSAPIPEGHRRPRLRCPSCGVICDVPASTTERVLKPSLLPTPAALVDGTDEDDGQPYRVPGDPERKEPCPKCTKPVARGAVVCNHCGFNRETGATHQRIHEKVDRQWDPVLGLGPRFGVYVAVQGLALGMMLVAVFADDDNAFRYAFSWLIGAVLLAFVLGSYARVNLTRNKKGRIRLTMTWYVCFVPLAPTDIRWHDCEGVITSLSHQTGLWDWLIVLFLVPWGLVPAILWWYYVVRPDQFDVSLTRDHGSPALLLYRGRSENMAKEMATTIRNVTGLT